MNHNPSSPLLTARAALVALVLTVAGQFALASPQEKTQKKPASEVTFGIQKRTYDFKEASKDMEYALFVPSKYDKAKKWPLVVALHGLGSNPQQIIRYPGLTQQAEKHGYLVVAPMGYNSRRWYGSLGKRGARWRRGDPENLGELSEKDWLVPASRTRKWVAKMKELGMEHTYIEVPDGDHIRPAFEKQPQIFEFFNKHRKSAKNTPGEAKGNAATKPTPKP
ncbi:MAG: hypothetical protein KAY65_09720 [Planctomycetes bacterium]|nr:hypothetical protein [Planctomycetota bacterium]